MLHSVRNSKQLRQQQLFRLQQRQRTLSKEQEDEDEEESQGEPNQIMSN